MCVAFQPCRLLELFWLCKLKPDCSELFSHAAADKENKSKASGSTRTGQTLRRARSDPLPDAGAALAVKSMRAKVQGLQRRALSKKGKLVLRTHHHLVPRMAMPTQVQGPMPFSTSHQLW